ncbi:MAG: hypothetical protein GXP41_09780 [Chloroflexi bacterium]|nr:hypothetical protein [Chloroflexota bacterium]
MEREQDSQAGMRVIPLANQEAALAALDRGKRAAAEGRQREARRLVSRALELDPRLVEGWVRRGWLAD